MPVSLSNDDALLIEALVVYHDNLRDRDPDHARRVWKRARDLAAEREETSSRDGEDVQIIVEPEDITFAYSCYLQILHSLLLISKV